jgi:hypothetical protein
MNSLYGCRQHISRVVTSSPRLRVVHCHVQLKCAFTIEGTDKADCQWREAGRGLANSRCFVSMKIARLISVKCAGKSWEVSMVFSVTS